MMTKKDYVMIAAAIKAERMPVEGTNANVQGAWTAGNNVALSDLALRLASEFKAANPRFDSARFLAACGVTQ